MRSRQTRRDWLRTATILTFAGTVGNAARAANDNRDSRWSESITKGLNWLSRTQSSRGQWNTQVYPTAMAALAGTEAAYCAASGMGAISAVMLALCDKGDEIVASNAVPPRFNTSTPTSVASGWAETTMPASAVTPRRLP